MTNDKVIFISLIGKGRGRSIEGSKGYQKAHYFFDEIKDTIHTSFFGLALYEVLAKQGYCVDKWLIFGTSESNWSELLFVLDEEYHDDMLELYDKVYDEEEKGISEELLRKWEGALQRNIPGIRLIIVDPLDYEVYVDHMIKEIPNEQRKVVLDITHAFRHMPVVIAFSLMALKHLKQISDIMVYYGAFELKKDRFNDNEPTPVLKIDFINTLVSYAESLATFNNSGYFPPLLDTIGITGSENTYFWLEMNRQPKSDLENISKRLKDKTLEANHEADIAKYIKQEIDPLIGASLDRRMVERARFFFDKKQYLKALILLYEGLILAIGRKHGFGNSLDYEKRQQVRKYISDNRYTLFDTKDRRETYFDLEYTRNAAAHGSRSKGTQNYVEHEDQFQKLFMDGLGVYGYITGEKL